MPAVLDDRSKEVLKLLIQLHIATGEPVGSESLSRLMNRSVSPATVRNIMAELEKQGYLSHPHTSAGRMPTDEGYRVYVDSLMDPSALGAREAAAIDRGFDDRIERNLSRRPTESMRTAPAPSCRTLIAIGRWRLLHGRRRRHADFERQSAVDRELLPARTDVALERSELVSVGLGRDLRHRRAADVLPKELSGRR